MKKYILALFFASSLLAGGLSTTNSTVAVDHHFIVKSTDSVFDNSLTYTHKPLLSCSPKLDAVYKIESETQLKVIPTSSLSSSTAYRCSYDEKSFTFKTEALKLLDVNYFEHEKMFRLSFNDTIDMSSMKSGLKFTKIDKLSKTNLQYKVIQNDGKHLVLKINESVGTKSIKLSINKKLKTTHGASFSNNYSELYNEYDTEVTLDSNKKSLSITDDPQMVSLANGEFALRIFVNDSLTGKSKKHIEIQGIDDFQVSGYKYMNYSIRNRYNIKDSYYYHDVTSKAFKPNTKYKVTLKKGLSTYYREIKDDVVYNVKTSDRSKAVLFDDKKPYISNMGELSFSSVNVEKATLIVERVLNDNLRYFMNFSSSNRASTDFYTKEIFSKKIILNTEKNRVLKQKFLLSDLNKGELPVGVYKVTIRYEELDYENKEEGEVRELFSSKILFLSDLGISANIAKEQAFVTVLSLKNAKPVEDATVQIYGANNALLGKATTNEDGVAIINNKKLLTLKPRGIIVQTHDDKNFLTLGEQISSPTPQDIVKNVERFKAHVYFQSNIVRPASTIHALITVKDRDFISASKLPIKLSLRDGQGKEIHKKVYHTDEYGLIDFSYQLDVADKTGNYFLRAFMGDTQIGYKKIKVEAFMPPKIENSIKTNKERYTAGELMEVNIRSSYLFGAPSSNLLGKVTLNARPVNYSNKAYKNYDFVNHSLAKENVSSYINQSEDIVLDVNGTFDMVLSAKLSQRVPSILEAMIGVTIMDDSQPVSSYKKVKIYPYKAMVGLKIDNDSFEKGQKLEGKAVLIDPHTGKKIDRELFVVVKRIAWHYDYWSGNYNWEQESKVVDSFSINSNETFSRTVQQNGDHVVEVHDRLGGHSASKSFDVWWWSYSNLSPSNDLSSVEIKFEDKLYKKGDKIEVQIKSPILEGQVLLTLEGEKVGNYKMVELHKGVAKTSITIKNDIKRGIRLHATAFRASDSPSKLIPFRAMGYKFVKPNRDVHKINIELNIAKVSKSKVPLSFQIKTDKPSKILVSIVDRGILQLVNQKTPKPFDFFNEKPDAQISYYDLYDQLLAHISEGKLVDFGAGDSLSKKKKHLAPDLGKRIKPFMIWSGILETKENKLTQEIQIPEFNGRAAVVVIAINNDGLGVATQDLVVKDDVMIKPSYPRYTLNGDKIEVPIRIFNTTKVSKSIELSSKTSKNLALQLRKTQVDVPANSSKVIRADLYPHSVGKGNITLTAKYDATAVTKSVKLPVFSPYALSTKTFKGITNQLEIFKIPKEYKDAKVFITLSDNLMGALRDDLKYLVRYPYGCAEQTSSKLSAMHYAKAFLKKDKLLKKSEHFILQGIKKLHNMQNYHGEFYYWEGGSRVNSYASLYAAQTLLAIEEGGGAVSKNFKNKIIKMLKAVSSGNGSYKGSYTNFHRVFAAYILADNNALPSSTANMLYEKKAYKDHFLATFYMAAILKVDGKDAKANKLFSDNSYELSRYAYKTYGNRTGNFESNVRDMMLHFIIKTKYFNKSSKDLIAIQKEFSNLYSTQSKAVALKAISTYLGQPKNSKIDVTVEINGESATYTEPEIISIDTVTSDAIILKPNGKALSYSIELVKNLPKVLKNETSSEKELSIEREFIDERGNDVEIQNLTQGDKFFSKVTIINYGKIDHVVINQRIPACVEIVNNNIKETEALFKDSNTNLEHKEIRDDRMLHFVNLRKTQKYSSSLSKYVLTANKSVYYTPLVATSIGECKLPAVITEAMYDARINDYAKASKTLIVRDLKSSKVVAKKSVKPNKPLTVKAPSSTKKEVKEISLSEKAETLVKEIYTREMNSNNPLEFSEFFSFPLSIYFRTKDFKKDELLADKRKYFKDWSQRSYTKMKTEVESSDKTKKEVKVKVSFTYKIYNGKKVLTGVSNHLLTVVQKDKKLFVTAVELWKKKEDKKK